MQDLLNHPAIQSGVAPFLAALITALLLQRVKLSGLAIIAGFAATVYLASDFGISPLTSTRKIIWLGLSSAALGLLLSLVRLPWFAALLPILGGAATVWVAMRILQHQPPQTALLWGAGCAAYVIILVWSMDTLENDPLRSANAAAALGFGTGGAALVGASALLGQLGLALGSAAAALVLLQMIFNRTFSTGRVFTLPLAAIAGPIGCMAVLGAYLPWYALTMLAAIPVATRIMPLPVRSLRIQSLLLPLPGIALAGSAVFAAWQSAGDVPY